MIVTVTANTTLDQVMFIPSFQPGKTIRATQTVHSLGGKPTDASWILGCHGVPSTALGFAAGAIGGKITGMLESVGVTVDFVQVTGESRMAIALVTEDDGAQTTITPNTLEVEPHHITELRDKFEALLPQATVVVTGGSLPNGVDSSYYTDFIALAKSYDVPVVLDAKPDNLLAGLPSGPDYIKPNHEEMAGFVGYLIETPEDAYKAGRKVFDEYGTASVISMGSGGAVAVLPDRAYRIPPIEIEVLSAVGAGDAVLAGIAYALHHNEPIEEGLRLGIGTATAVCLHPGTAMFHMEDAERFIPQVELIPFP